GTARPLRSPAPTPEWPRKVRGVSTVRSPVADRDDQAVIVSDEDLLRRTGQGDSAAFDQLYRRFADAVFRRALRQLRDRNRAEDATQETFAAIWRSASTYKPERGLGAPWLFAVARNAVVNQMRARVATPMEAPDTI